MFNTSTVAQLGDTNPLRNCNLSCCNNYPNYANSNNKNKNNANPGASNYLNCAASKSVLAHNCHMVRRIQRDYPAYPSDVGIYHASASTVSSAPISPYNRSPSHAPRGANQYAASARPNNLEIISGQKSGTSEGIGSGKVKGPRHPSILKNYKSCPVSPVHEELDWATVDDHNSLTDDRQQESVSNKRHSMYSDDAKIILDMIHADTEKMIAEITQKYGDLGVDAGPSVNKSAKQLDYARESKFLSDEEGFSSDSLEDCSLDLELTTTKCQTNPRTRKSVCRKKHRKHDVPAEVNSTLPKRSVSDYFIHDEFYSSRNRNISLSDILNPDEDKAKQDYAFLNSQRHSSASFFLAPERKSQESLMSDELSGCGGGVSYCNSMESILSDESECKSAPLEALFDRTKREITRCSAGYNDYGRNEVAISSKSYGSSPNNPTAGALDYYMDQTNPFYYDREACNVSGYDYDSLVVGSNRCSPLPPPPPEFRTSISNTRLLPTSNTFPALSTLPAHKMEEYIPRLASKNDQYSVPVNKSLSKEFANHRYANNSNPIYGCDDESDFFQRKTIKPTVPAKPTKLMPAETTNGLKKSCSFEIEMFHSRGRALQQKSAAKKYEQNLQKFEKERNTCRGRGNHSARMDDALNMNYVPHKPPVANRRSASMRTKRSAREKDRYHTVSQFPSTVDSNRNVTHASATRGSNKRERKNEFEAEEKTHEIYVAEKGMAEDDNMDSLELYTKPNLHKENSIDSLDDIGPRKRAKSRELLDRGSAGSCSESEKSIVTADFLSQAEYVKFRDIEKKIDVINKLVELEEKKLEQERFTKEIRMRPFACNANEKGYVKSLTLNFDNLAKTMQFEKDLSQRLSERDQIKRNYSLPDVLEVANYRLFANTNDLDEEYRIRKQRKSATEAENGGVRHTFQIYACSFSILSTRYHFVSFSS